MPFCQVRFCTILILCFAIVLCYFDTLSGLFFVMVVFPPTSDFFVPSVISNFELSDSFISDKVFPLLE